MTFANRVLGLRLAPALQIDKAKVVPVFTPILVKNAYSRQHPFAELCANSEHGDGKDAILHDKKVGSWRQDPERKISIIMSNVPTIGRHEQRRYQLWI